MRKLLGAVLLVSAIAAPTQSMRSLWFKRETYLGVTARAVHCARQWDGATVVAIDDPNGAVIQCYGPDGSTRWHKKFWTDTTAEFHFLKLLPMTNEMYVVGNATWPNGDKQMVVGNVYTDGRTPWIKKLSRFNPIDTVARDAVVGSAGNLFVAGSEGLMPMIYCLDTTGKIVGQQWTGDGVLPGSVDQIAVAPDWGIVAHIEQEGSGSGIWTMSSKLFGSLIAWTQPDRITSITVDNQGDVGICGDYVANGSAAGAFVAKNNRSGSQIWRKAFPGRQAFSWVQADSLKRLVAYQPDESTFTLFASYGAPISKFWSGVTGSTLGDHHQLFDRYDRRYDVAALTPESGLSTVGVVRGSPFRGVDSLYRSGYLLNTSIRPTDAYVDTATGDIVYTANDDHPIVGRIAQAPEAVDDRYTVSAGVAFTPAVGIVYNDRYAASASATLKTRPVSGTLSLNANGKFSYTPNAGFTGTDTFQYVVSKPGLKTSTGTVFLTVR